MKEMRGCKKTVSLKILDEGMCRHWKVLASVCLKQGAQHASSLSMQLIEIIQSSVPSLLHFELPSTLFLVDLKLPTNPKFY